MRKIVFDSSALLAVLRREKGVERASALLQDPSVEVLMSAVNLSEVHAVLVRQGVAEDSAWAALDDFYLTVIPFDAEHARATGAMIALTQEKGLSMGDRACLALGRQKMCLVVTADRPFTEVGVGVEVELIRS